MLKTCRAIFFLCVVSYSASIHVAQDQPNLHLTSEIISERYCESDEELALLQLTLKLTYRNFSKRSIIIYKGSHYVSQQRIARSEADIKSRRYEVDSSFTWVDNGNPPTIDKYSLTDSFVVPPNGVYETQTTTGVFFLRKGDELPSHISGSIAPGNYVLQVTVSTWDGSAKVADRLRKRWRDKGFLWTDVITSSPVEFTAQRQNVLKNCSGL